MLSWVVQLVDVFDAVFFRNLVLIFGVVMLLYSATIWCYILCNLVQLVDVFGAVHCVVWLNFWCNFFLKYDADC